LKKDANEFTEEYLQYSGAIRSLMTACQNFHRKKTSKKSSPVQTSFLELDHHEVKKEEGLSQQTPIISIKTDNMEAKRKSITMPTTPNDGHKLKPIESSPRFHKRGSVVEINSQQMKTLISIELEQLKNSEKKPDEEQTFDELFERMRQKVLTSNSSGSNQNNSLSPQIEKGLLLPLNQPKIQI
jgi:hypothetical protein